MKQKQPDSISERQANFYQNAKKAGTLKKPIKVSESLKIRFDNYREEKELTVDEAFNRMLEKVKA